MKLYKLQRHIDTLDRKADGTITVFDNAFGEVTHRIPDMDVVFQDRNGTFHQISRASVRVLMRSVTRKTPCLILSERK